MRPALLAAALALLAGAGCIDAQPCPTPLQSCGGTCFDLGSDRLNCGACGAACGAGLACVGGRCVEDAASTCALRTGGAFVTLGLCGSTVKVWTTSDSFIAAAAALVGSPPPGAATVPVFDLRSGTDCDAQWSWSTEPVTPSFAGAPPDPACSACPDRVEAELALWLSTILRWCPAEARVLAVDPR